MILGRQKALLNKTLDLPRYTLATIGYGHKTRKLNNLMRTNFLSIQRGLEGHPMKVSSVPKATY